MHQTYLKPKVTTNKNTLYVLYCEKIVDFWDQYLHLKSTFNLVNSQNLQNLILSDRPSGILPSEVAEF